MPRTGRTEISLPCSRSSVGRAEAPCNSVAANERNCSSRNDKTFATRKLKNTRPPSSTYDTCFMVFYAKFPREEHWNPAQRQFWRSSSDSPAATSLGRRGWWSQSQTAGAPLRSADPPYIDSRFLPVEPETAWHLPSAV